MSFDILIKGGSIVDGTGASARLGNLAIKGGKIVGMDDVVGEAKHIIEADQKVVAPGFIDPHTHYDAQIFWDKNITPSSWHGVTTVIMGNCGVGIAPCRNDFRDIAMHDLVNVEAIPYEVLEKGITWSWETFPQYLDAAEKLETTLNLAFLAPLTPFRHFVMGTDSLTRPATSDETGLISSLLGLAIDAGAFGFSSTVLNQHIGYHGKPLACRLASNAELKAYANVLKEKEKGAIEIALTKKISVLEFEQFKILNLLLEESERPVTFIALFDRDDISEAVRETLKMVEPLISKGVRPQTSPLPLTREVDMRSPFSFAAFPSWKKVFENKSKIMQTAIYSNKSFRDQFRDELKEGISFGNWDRVVLHSVQNPNLKMYEGQSITKISHSKKKDGVDTLLDLTLEDDLDIEFTITTFNNRPRRMAELLQNKSVLIGLGDGGAHVDMLCDAGYPTYLLGHWVREKGVISLEEAVRRLSSVPADLFGIKDRGRLQVGLAADVTVFDPQTIGSSNRGEKRYDLPGNAKRMVMPSQGIDCSVVNGKISYANGTTTGSGSGKVLRS